MKKVIVIVPTHKKSLQSENQIKKIDRYFESQSIDCEVHFLPILTINFICNECVNNYLCPEAFIHITNKNKCFNGQEYLDIYGNSTNSKMVIIDSSIFYLIALEHSLMMKHA